MIRLSLLTAGWWLLITSIGVQAQSLTSSPAFTCIANAGVPPIVRSEGLTELVGDLILNCSGGTPTPRGQPIARSNVQVFLNTKITSRILTDSNISEATLMIDEPYPADMAVPVSAPVAPNAPTKQDTCSVLTPSGLVCRDFGVGPQGFDPRSPLGPVGSNGPYNGFSSAVLFIFAPSINVFLGTQSGPNSIVWNGIPIDSPGVNSRGQLNTRTIRITNIRANACLLGISSTLIPTQIVMYVAINGSQQVAINNPQQTVAFLQRGLIPGTSSVSYQQCNNLNASLLNANLTGTPGYAPINLVATEGFASSFKVRNWGQVQAGLAATPDTPPTYQNVPGFSYNTESGFYSQTTLVNVSSYVYLTPGLADSGTRISFALSGIPAGVSLLVPSLVPLYPSGGSSGQTGAAMLVAGASNGAVSINGGNATLTYEITAADPNVLEALTVPLTVAFNSDTSRNLPGLGQSTVTIGFAPLFESAVATTGPIPRFCQNGLGTNLFAINACSCNLLFPFVTNQAGFDTGIAIANTSLDPFGTAPQSGTVTLSYYGNTSGGGAAPAAQTSQTVNAGTELVFTLSNGGNLGIAPVPGFQGYIVASSKFQWCHGFAFISDLGALKLAEGYLALQIDESGLSRTGTAGEVKAH